jgi:hypothetical protein
MLDSFHVTYLLWATNGTGKSMLLLIPRCLLAASHTVAISLLK